MHVLPKVILHHAHLQTIFFRETKTKFLCRTKLTGALGAILAQAPRAPEKWFSFFCAFQFFSSRAVMFPAQSVAMRWGGLGDIKTYYQLPPEVWNAFVEMAGDPGDDLKLLAALPPEVVAASLSRAKLGDGEYLTAVHASHVGLVYRLARRILHVKGGGDWDQWGGYFTMARHFHNTFGSYTNGNSCSIYGKETEDDADLGSRRRWRFCGGARGHEGKVVSTIPPNHGRMAPRGGGGAVIRTAFRLTQADERSRHCTIRGLCNICPVWSTCIASFKVSNIRGITEWLRDEGTTWSGVFPSVESLLQGIPHCDVDAGCNDDVYASQLRSNDRKAEPFVPFSLAFGLLSRRVGQIITLEQDEIQDHYGHQEWHPTSKKLGPVQTLGPHLPKSNSGRTVLADTSSRTGFGMGGFWISWSPKDPSRTDSLLDDAGRHGGDCTHGGGPGEITEEETIKEGEEGKQKEERWGERRRIPKENHERWRAQGVQGEAEAFCVEQWKWALWGIAAWASLCGKNQKRAQVHDMQLPRSPFEILSPKAETKLGKQHPADARSRSRRRRRDAEEGSHWNKDRRNKGRHGSSGDGSRDRERRRREDERDVHEARGDPKATTEEAYFASRVFRFIHYFAGPNDPLAEALQEAAAKEGLRVDIHSVEKKVGSGDLLDDEPYGSDLREACGGRVDGFHAGFPCGSFSRLRFRRSQGYPGPVRTKKEPYGMRGNSRKQQKEADDGTIMAARSINMAKAVATARPERKVVPVSTLENPPPTDHPEHLSAWELPEMDAFKLLECCATLVFHTCQYQLEKPIEQRHYKPQMFVGSLYNLRSLTRFCECDGGPKQHDPVVGKEKSEAAGEYPKAFCESYAALVMQHFRKMGREEFLLHRMKQLGEKIEVTREEIDKKKVVLVPNVDTSRSSTHVKTTEGLEDTDTGVPSKAEMNDATKEHEFQGGDGKYGMLKKSTSKASDPNLLNFVGGMKDPCKVVQPMSNLLSLGRYAGPAGKPSAKSVRKPSR